MTLPFRHPVVVILLLLAVAWPAGGMVNPSLQPFDLSERHRVVVAAKVKGVDEEKQAVSLEVAEVLQGDFAPKEITLTYAAAEGGDGADPMGGDVTPGDLQEGQLIVAWVGGKTRGAAGSVLMYVGDRQWHTGELADAAQPGQWKWTAAAPETMVGTFNGQSQRLIEMLEQAQGGRHFFPAMVYARFKEDQVLATLDGPIAGVALHDLDNSGTLDAIAAAPSGIKVLLQKQPGSFEDATAALGLDGVSGSSVGIADVQGDGQPDLLIDGTIYTAADGKYTKSDLLPPGAGNDLKVSTFVDVNADGYPDVLVSARGHGLTVYQNPGKPGGPFTNATEATGLGAAAPEGNGYITPGDWNLDGRVDLFYATGKGLLLEQQADGRFTPVKLATPLDFRGGPKLDPAVSGAGAFAPIWRDDRLDLILPTDTGMTLLTREDGKVTDVSGYGNELALSSVSQSATLAEDLDMDGYVDLLTISREPTASNSYHTNRGYGSFMHAEVYTPEFWPGESYRQGAGGVAAGDANRDGANDLLVGGLDGRLVLVISDALSLRQASDHPVHHLKVLQQTAIAAVKLQTGLGTIGARITIEDEKGQVVALRTIGQSILTGCRGPNEANIAIRRPGPHTVRVRYSDGHEATRSVELKPAERTEIQISRQ